VVKLEKPLTKINMRRDRKEVVVISAAAISLTGIEKTTNLTEVVAEDLLVVITTLKNLTGIKGLTTNLLEAVAEEVLVAITTLKSLIGMEVLISNLPAEVGEEEELLVLLTLRKILDLRTMRRPCHHQVVSKKMENPRQQKGRPIRNHDTKGILSKRITRSPMLKDSTTTTEIKSQPMPTKDSSTTMGNRSQLMPTKDRTTMMEGIPTRWVFTSFQTNPFMIRMASSLAQMVLIRKEATTMTTMCTTHPRQSRAILLREAKGTTTPKITSLGNTRPTPPKKNSRSMEVITTQTTNTLAIITEIPDLLIKVINLPDKMMMRS